METILVLTDFSYSAFNAARYAVNLANQLHTARVLLYHSFTTNRQDTFPPFASEVEDRWIQTLERLNELKSSLEMFTERNTKIDIMTDCSSLQEAIDSMRGQRKIGLVVMGSTGNNKLRRLFIGSNTMSISDTCRLPLLIVPPDTEFEKIERAVFACDARCTDQVPVSTIEHFIEQLHLKLAILYFENEGAEAVNNYVEKKAISKLVGSINPENSHIHGGDVVEDIINFSNANNIQMIIVIHKQQRFLQNIFHPGTNNQLAYYSHLPLLILKPAKHEYRVENKEKAEHLVSA